MAQTYKPLAQVKPSATSLVDAYTVPAATAAVVSTVVVCNQSATPTAFRISVAVAALGDTPKQYVAYDVPILGNQSIPWTIGITLGAGDVLRVYNTLATLSFNVFGAEIT